MTGPPTRLLYIDDDEGLGRLVQKGLGRLGCTVTTAGDGPSGLAALGLDVFDVVAVDHYMPGQDGLATLAAIRARPDAPPVVYVTGTDESAIAIAALKAGAADYVVKTAGGDFLPLLAAAVEKAMAGVRLRRDKEATEAELRAQRDRFEALAAERALLMREVNHRVGNSLQIIAALLHLQSSAAGSEEVKSALAAANRRVMAVAQVHRRLYTSDDVGTVALDQYLHALVGDLKGGQNGDGGVAAHLTLEAEPVEVDPDAAVAVGVLVTELVLNAVKYAYPNGDGPIRVKLAAAGERRVHLSVEDDGVGRGPVEPDRRTPGLGRMIVKAMASKLGAEWGQDEAHPGMRVALSFDRPPPRPQAA